MLHALRWPPDQNDVRFLRRARAFDLPARLVLTKDDHAARRAAAGQGAPPPVGLAAGAAAPLELDDAEDDTKRELARYEGAYTSEWRGKLLLELAVVDADSSACLCVYTIDITCT